MYLAKLQKNKQKKGWTHKSLFLIKNSFIYFDFINKKFLNIKFNSHHIRNLNRKWKIEQKVINNKFKKWEKVGNFRKY